HAARRAPRERAGIGEKAERRLRRRRRVAHGGEAAEGRPRGLRALLERRAREAVVAFREQALEQRMLGEFGLDQHLAGLRAAPGASGHRSEERRVGKECRSRWWAEQSKRREDGSR